MNFLTKVISVIFSCCIFLHKSYSDETDYQKNAYAANEKSKCTDTPLPKIINGQVSRFDNEAEVTCNPGFKLIGAAKIKCEFNEWKPVPRCIQEVDQGISLSCNMPVIDHATVEMYPPYLRKLGLVKCDSGYYVKNDVLPSESTSDFYITCNNGQWIYVNNGWQSPIPKCIQAPGKCPDPPVIPDAIVHFPEDSLNYRQIYKHGEIVKYDCKTGYHLTNSKVDSLTCIYGRWQGEQPVCLPSVLCAKPTNIRHGRWSIKRAPTTSSVGIDGYGYPVGVEILYECYSGYNMVGPPIIECLSNKQWSHHAPKCEDIIGTYCPSLDVPNGKCKCESYSDLSFCEPFFTDMTVECTCNHGYSLIGNELLRCTSEGTWNSPVPTCIKDDRTNTKSDLVADSNGGTHMNTLAIVIATACSVLGVLLFIMVIMVFRRRKPRPRLYHQVSGAPPPYTRVHSNSLDEHDRVALIGYENAPRLPSYEEATRSNSRSHRSDGRISNDYRPLPHIPGNIRNNFHGNGPPHSPQHNTDSNRHSIITTSTINRDALSEMFGSIDTVNVSMSDASTSVTVDTLDSGTSRPSNGSERATAGSLSSSQENVTTEDAPLIENSDRNEEQVSRDEQVEEDDKDQS